ncbi:MAG: uridine kinase [Firmicutes bacterium]|nr:uridine kinase [Bacillota bacterium]MEE3382986.1 uridine kinase [Anaerovoracaceae bacterium]MBQ1431255.1 uridine kinase [Bacillota bacterium]MBQ1630111.1 uridine kinase [Bacillota bacterium]MBQ1689903.1 uridine kinase [Bacillota bacterium]
MKDAIIIGIAGGTGCGKSTMIRKIKEEFNDEISILSHDFYYKQHNDITFEERKKINYDHPNAFDTDIMIQHIKELAKGNPIERPVYDFTIHNRVDETVRVEPARVIVVEGILIFENKELRDLCDIKVYIDTDADVRIIRRILRDVNERGRTLDNIVQQYLTTVKPMHDEFVEPSKRYADIIVPEGGFNKVALDMLNERIHALLRD